jgi:serine protease Do
VKVEAADPWLDLAVLRIAADDLKPIQFGDAGKLKKGQLVVALGNPHAIARDGEVSASWGIISNLKRAAPPLAGVDPPGDKDTLHHYGTLIQTDARLSQGASGGALINLKGEMIGLTSSLAALSSGEGNAGFAIPVNDTFKRDVDVLKLGRVPDFGFLGVSLDEVSTELALSGARGAIISAVVCAPAAGSGLFDGDLVTRINDEPIASRSDLFREVGSLPPGAEMEIGVVRNGRPIAPISVKLSKKYPLTSRPPYASVAPSKWRGLQVDYATAVPSDVLNLRRFDLDVAGCVVISSVEQDSSAWKAGLRRWTFVSHVGETRVDNPEAFHRAVNGLAGDVRLRLSTQTGGELRSVPAE